MSGDDAAVDVGFGVGQDDGVRHEGAHDGVEEILGSVGQRFLLARGRSLHALGKNMHMFRTKQTLCV